jgi:hypothetical protein
MKLHQNIILVNIKVKATREPPNQARTHSPYQPTHESEADAE